MKNWPCWHPGLELRADHLLGLEDYLLERTRLGDPSFGIAELDWKKSINLNKSDDDWLLTVERLKGITPSGQPIRVESDNALDTQIPADIETFDLWIRVNPEDEDKEGRKLKLIAAEAPYFETPSLHEEQLHLGRYHCEDDHLDLVEPPIPLFLSAFQPLDDSWHGWVSHLAEAIEVRGKFLEEKATDNPRFQAAFNELVRLSIDWQIEPIVHLVRRLERVQRLTAWALSPDLALPVPIQESDIRSVLGTSGKSLPFELAEIISTVPMEKPPEFGILSPGMIIQTELRKKACVIEEFIGGGRKGEVYRTKMDTSPVALKWYFPELANFEREEALRLLIDIGSPSNTFLWPVDIAKSDDVDGFGYIMPLKDTRLSSIADLLQQKIEPPVRCLATAGLNLTRGYKELHDKSLCYQDISPDDVLFDSKLGEIYICNNDNIQIDDQQIGEGVSLGFVAPEVVRGEAKPGSQSDLFSLAVLLFCIFVRHHPFEGERFEIEHLDHPEKVRLYGTEPVFIFDPVNDSNRCVGAKEFWYHYPEFLRELFTKSFTSGVSDPQNARLLETEWCTAMVRLRDSIILCNECQSENYYDLKTLKTKKHPGACQACRKDIGLPPRLRVGKEVTMLYLNTEIYPYHVSGQTTYDFSKPSAKVVPHHTKPGILGLKNLTENKWVRFRNNNPEDVEPGRSVTIDAGTTIDFGQVKGEIRTDPFGKV